MLLDLLPQYAPTAAVARPTHHAPASHAAGLALHEANLLAILRDDEEAIAILTASLFH